MICNVEPKKHSLCAVHFIQTPMILPQNGNCIKFQHSAKYGRRGHVKACMWLFAQTGKFRGNDSCQVIWTLLAVFRKRKFIEYKQSVTMTERWCRLQKAVKGTLSRWRKRNQQEERRKMALVIAILLYITLLDRYHCTVVSFTLVRCFIPVVPNLRVTR